MVLDGRQGGVEACRDAATIGQLCREYHTDGLMILDTADGYDFAMEFFNPDGSGGMMCGNGGRCIVAFADYLGIKPADGAVYRFLAPDGPHTAQILTTSGEGLISGSGSSPAKPCHNACIEDSVGKIPGTKTDLPQKTWTVKLKMIDVEGVEPTMNGYFLNTGTRHYVEFVPDVNAMDMEKEARPIRWDKAFQPEGTNVNFVQVTPEGLLVRTFEKGVEGETLACGTGLTASAIAASYHSPGAMRPRGAGALGPQSVEDNTTLETVSYRLQCRRGDWLQVEFKKQGRLYTDVYLTGPAELVK